MMTACSAMGYADGSSEHQISRWLGKPALVPRPSRWHTLHPDVVLMDLSMPTMDGIAATAALRASAPHSAVVLLSLYDDATMRARAHAAGAVTLVGKREGVKALLAAIREIGKQGHQSPQERNR